MQLSFSEIRTRLKAQWGRYADRLFITGIILSITFCEWVFAFKNVSFGITLALALAVLIYFLLSFVKLGKAAVLSAESLALIPLYILFTSSLPWFFLDQQLRLPAVYIIVIVLCAWHIYQNDIDLGTLGLKKENSARWAALGVLLGIPAGAAEYFAIAVEPSFPTFQIKYFVRDLAYMIFFVGLGEEVLFRGLIQNSLKNMLGRWWGILLTAYIFMVMHMTWHSNLELTFTFYIGLAFGIFYEKTGSLVGPVVMHGVGNTVLAAVMPYLKF